MDNEVENNGIEVVAEEQKKQKKIKEVKKNDKRNRQSNSCIA